MKKSFWLTPLAFFPLFAIAQAPQIDESLKVNLIQLDVKAHSLGGNFLTGLTEDDFIVRENGVVQEIDKLELIDVATLEADRLQDVQSRVMLMVDLINTTYPVTRRVFPQLKKYVLETWDGKSELGLSLFTNGVIEVVPFTTDREALLAGISEATEFYKKNKNRSYGKLDSDAFGGRFISNYDRPELDVVGQYVQYLGAYTGKKNLILISENWDATKLAIESELEDDVFISMRDIQTAGVFNNLTISSVSLARGSKFLNSRNGNFYLEPSADLAGLTGGTYTKVPLRDAGKAVARTVERGQRFYRIQYYSQYDGRKYRKINVEVKGMGRLADSADGFYPRKPELGPADVNLRLSFDMDYNFTLAASSNWLRWKGSIFGGKRANYAVAQLAFGAGGQKIAEQVIFGELGDGRLTRDNRLRKSFTLPIPKGQKPWKIETTLIDLSTGQKVVTEQIVNKDPSI